MSRRVALVAVVALLGLSACSDDSASTGSAAVTTEATTESTTPATTTGDTATADTATDDTATADTAVDDTVVDDTFPDATPDPNAPGVGSEFCDIGDELDDNEFDPFTASRGEIEAYFNEEFPDMFGRLREATPPELADDVATIGSFYAQLTSELETNGWDMNAAFENPAIQETMSGPEINAAGDNLDAYCGL